MPWPNEAAGDVLEFDDSEFVCIVDVVASPGSSVDAVVKVAPLPASPRQ